MIKNKKIIFNVFLLFFVAISGVFAEISPEWGGEGTLSKYGLSLDDLSHQNQNIECRATLRLTVKVPKPLGLYYQVSDFNRKVIYRDNFEYSDPYKNEFWGLIQFPEKGRYIIRVYISDGGFNKLLYYIVDCTSGYKDGGNAAFIGNGFSRFDFSVGDLPSADLLIVTEEPLKMSFTNNKFILRYNVGILDMSHKPKFISTEPNLNNENFYRYSGKSDSDIFLYFKKTGYYIVRIYASEELNHGGDLLAEYVVNSTKDQVAENAVAEVFIDQDSKILTRDWYQTETRLDTAALDEYIKNTPLSLRNDPNLLTAYFTKKAKTEYEKARAAYVWLQYFIHYDLEMAATNNQTSEVWVYRSSIEGMLERRYAVCNGYARLFVLFCRLMDMEAVLIVGDLKGSTIGHAWNAVLIDGNWRLLDATSNVEAKQIREKSFLPNPYEFIKTHYPKEDFWQLIDQPVSKEEAKKMGFFK